VLTPLQNATLTEVHIYVASQPGQDRIRHALQRHRLPTALDADIEEMVLAEARRFVQAGGEITSAPGWCNARIRARAVDLARGAIRRDAAHTELARRHGHPGASPTMLDDTAMPDDSWGHDTGRDLDDRDLDDRDLDDRDLDDQVAPLDENLAALRRAVLTADAAPLDVCGTLTAIAVLADAAVPVPDCPRPQAGATRVEAACWAGLWYAKRTECFGEGNTVTKRRSRASKRIKALLHAAVGGAA
jgi:hypothetical protein